MNAIARIRPNIRPLSRCYPGQCEEGEVFRLSISIIMEILGCLFLKLLVENSIGQTQVAKFSEAILSVALQMFCDSGREVSRG